MSESSRPPENLPVSFASFLVSLGSSALVHLGEIPDPASGATTRELVLAHHTIEVLGLLQEKTKGNLDDDERQLLEALLFELRTKYLAASSSAS